MRIFLSMLLACAVGIHLSQFASGQTTDARSLAELRSLVGVVIQEKDGVAIAIDFRKCNASWTEVFPKVLDVASLQSVTMTGPLATHERIVALAVLPNLRSLRLDQSLATDATLQAMAQFPKLEDINLEGCKISETGLRNLSKLTSLKRLRIAKTNFSDEGLVPVESMRQLELLDLSDCTKISNAGLVRLKGLTKLRNLSLGSPLITDEGLQHLKPLTNMVAISLKDCGVADSNLDAFSGMSKLKEFDVFKTRAGDNALGVVAGAKELAKLKLRDSAITNRGLIEHIGRCDQLIALDLGETGTSDPALVAIGKLGKLEDLNLLRTKVTDAGVASLTTLQLKRLNLDDIPTITDGAIPHIAKMGSLEFLHLGKTAVTDAGLLGLIPLGNLKDLILNNTAITESAINEFQAKMPKVKIVR